MQTLQANRALLWVIPLILGLHGAGQAQAVPPAARGEIDSDLARPGVEQGERLGFEHGDVAGRRHDGVVAEGGSRVMSLKTSSDYTVRMTRFIALSVLTTLLSACSGVRFVIDAVPAEDGLVETTIMEDAGGGWGSPSKVAMWILMGSVTLLR